MARGTDCLLQIISHTLRPFLPCYHLYHLCWGSATHCIHPFPVAPCHPMQRTDPELAPASFFVCLQIFLSVSLSVAWTSLELAILHPQLLEYSMNHHTWLVPASSSSFLLGGGIWG
jgi:hypothetical protein